MILLLMKLSLSQHSHSQNLPSVKIPKNPIKKIKVTKRSHIKDNTTMIVPDLTNPIQTNIHQGIQMVKDHKAMH